MAIETLVIGAWKKYDLEFSFLASLYRVDFCSDASDYVWNLQMI